MARSQTFRFDGGAGSYLGTGIAAFLLTLFTLGIGAPWAIVLRQKWRAKHTTINGVRLEFTGSGLSLIGQWLKWLALITITLGIYGFWVGPRIQRWIVEHTDFAPHTGDATPPPPAP